MSPKKPLHLFFNHPPRTMNHDTIAIFSLQPEYSDMRTTPQELRDLGLSVIETEYIDIVNIKLEMPGWKGGCVRSLPRNDFFPHIKSICAGILYGFNIGIHHEGIRDAADQIMNRDLPPGFFYTPQK